MDTNGSPFLTAEWLHLAILNFEIDPAAIRPFVPAGTELDRWNGKTLVSLVGFQFRNTRVWGLPIPFHRDFEEVNLRFYVRRKVDSGWRRAVVFVRELAPRRAIAWAARVFFGENYLTVPVRHRLELNGHPESLRKVAYWWSHAGHDYRLQVAAAGPAHVPSDETQEAFTTKREWGYSGRSGRQTIEYRVDHPPWPVRAASEARFEGDAGSLYGERFAESLSTPPASAFLMDGSAVTLSKGATIA